MRDYVKAQEMKKASMDWRQLLHRQWKSSTLVRVAALRVNTSFKTEEDRVRAFVASGAGSRAKYFRILQKLRDLGVVSRQDAPLNESSLMIA